MGVADEGNEEGQHARKEQRRGAVLIKDGGRHASSILARELTHDDDVIGGGRACQDEADQPEGVRHHVRDG